jgi:hypothetical protein
MRPRSDNAKPNKTHSRSILKSHHKRRTHRDLVGLRRLTVTQNQQPRIEDKIHLV